MPTYDYACGKCNHIQEDFRDFSDRTNPMACKKCGGIATQMIPLPAFETLTSDERWVREHEVKGNGVRSQC